MKPLSTAQFQVTIMTQFEVRQMLSRELLSTPFLQVTMTYFDAKTTMSGELWSSAHLQSTMTYSEAEQPRPPGHHCSRAVRTDGHQQACG